MMSYVGYIQAFLAEVSRPWGPIERGKYFAEVFSTN